MKKLHWIGHFSGFYCFFPENPVFYTVKVKNENHLRVKFVKQKLFHMFQVTFTFFLFWLNLKNEGDRAQKP